MSIKICSQCGRKRDVRMFFKNSGKKDGLDAVCVDYRKAGRGMKGFNKMGTRSDRNVNPISAECAKYKATLRATENKE